MIMRLNWNKESALSGKCAEAEESRVKYPDQSTTRRPTSMKTKYLKTFITAAVGLAIIVTTMTACTQTQPSGPTQAQTTETRLGKLNFENGFPTAETTQKLFDEMDYQRAVQAYLWAYPAVSFESIRVGRPSRSIPSLATIPLNTFATFKSSP
jgi:hypothetical protein